jgi:hypothetical protein
VSVFVEALSIREALERTAAHGHAYVPDALDPVFVRALDRELDGGPWRRFEHDEGAVRMRIEGFDVEAPMRGFPEIGRLRDELEALVHREATGIRGLATWRPNEAGAVRYHPSAMGITAHMDGKWYRRLVVVATVRGDAPFSIHEARAAAPAATWIASAGGLTLLRAPGLAGARDGRPFHSVPGPERGTRISLALRMSVDPPGDPPGDPSG